MTDEREPAATSGPASGVDRDILAARRARRAAETPDSVLIRRAEAAEATVQTLQAHLTNLQERLEETTEKQRRISDQLADREHELRQVKQREYAEQQLRVEAQERYDTLQSERSAEIEGLRRRVQVSEGRVAELADQMEVVRRELAEAQQSAVVERRAAEEAQQRLVAHEAQMRERESAIEQALWRIDERLTAASSAQRRSTEETSRASAEHPRDILQAGLMALETRATEVQAEVDAQRSAREQSDRELVEARQRLLKLKGVLQGLRQSASSLRGAIEHERDQLQARLADQRDMLVSQHAAELAHERDQLQRRYESDLAEMRSRVQELESELAATAGRLGQRADGADDGEPEPPTEGDRLTLDEARSREMAAALAAAVERLRERADAQREADDPGMLAPATGSEVPSAVSSAPDHGIDAEPAAGSPEPATDLIAPTDTTPPPAATTPAFVRERPVPLANWLAPAIRGVAERRDSKLAGELIVELLPAQKLVVGHPMTYAIEIEGVGSFRVRLDGERTAVEAISDLDQAGKVDFRLRGAPQAFSELAGGGTGRRLRPKVRGSRRAARKLAAARRKPLALASLAGAGICVWPGLMLLAVAEAIDPSWTKGHMFTVAFDIEGKQSATILLSVRDGEPVVVTRVQGEEPLVTVTSTEGGFMCLLGGIEVTDGETLSVEGSQEALALLLGWVDRAQVAARSR